MKLLEGKVCLVTGTSRGIGKEIAHVFASEGAWVYAHAREDRCIDEWCSQLQKTYGNKVTPVYFDLTDSAGMKDTIRKIKKESGKLDVLVNNAGMVTNELIGMIETEKVRRMFEVNVFCLIELTQLVVMKFMMRQKGGSVINIASIVAVEGSSGQAAYSASKGAVISFTRSAAKELASHQIRMNSVAPGITHTERIEKTVQELYKGKIPKLKMERMASPEDIAKACLYFASDASSYVTGQILTVGGGFIPE